MLKQIFKGKQKKWIFSRSFRVMKFSFSYQQKPFWINESPFEMQIKVLGKHFEAIKSKLGKVIMKEINLGFIFKSWKSLKFCPQAAFMGGV